MNSIAPFRGKAFFVPAGLFFLAFAAVFFSACDALNTNLKEDIDYHLSLHPVKSREELVSAIGDVPPNGTGTFTLMADIVIDSVLDITNKTIVLEAYAGTDGEITIRKTPYTDPFFRVNGGGKLILGGNRDKGTLVLDGEGAGAHPLVTVSGGGDLTLNNGAELRNNGNKGVEISGSTSVFTMNGGSISENNEFGVEVKDYARFTMTGGSISENNSSGVNIKDDARFTMYEGTITGNSAWRGGGVYLNSGGAFTMYGGSITGNRAGPDGIWPPEDGGGGGVFINCSSDTFEMHGGTISGNTAEWGAGVYVQFSTTFIMRGGSVTGNRADDKGGGVYVQYDRDGDGSGTFEMYEGSITGNTAVSNGGGVYLQGDSAKPDGGKLTMSGGTIGGNTAVNGAGVYAGADNAHFTMSGSAAVLPGNAVYLPNSRTIDVTGVLNPPGGIAAVITSQVTTPATPLVKGEAPYSLTSVDVEKFRYNNAGTLMSLVFDSAVTGEGRIPPP